MSTALFRIGGLLIVGAVLYLVIWDIFLGGADNTLARRLLLAGGAALAGGVVARMAGRATAGILSRSCPRCGRRVARGRVYCDEHLQETINEYRDRQRDEDRG